MSKLRPLQTTLPCGHSAEGGDSSHCSYQNRYPELTLTGYGTDPLGEAEVQAFLLGAKFRAMNGVLLLGLLRGVHQQRQHHLIPLKRPEVRARLRAAYRRGRNAQFDPDTWQPEQWWGHSLVEVQRIFGL